NAFALTNLDDKNGEFMLQNTKAQKFTYSTRTLADFKTKIIESDFEGMEIQLQITNYDLKSRRKLRNDCANFQLVTPFVGKFNAQNLTAVFGAAILLFGVGAGLAPAQIAPAQFGQPQGLSLQVLEKLSALTPVSGRFETIRANGITAIVDYAHTPDALKNVLATINDIKLSSSTLITVVGCGGNRDKGKRPLMAKEAVEKSDTVIFTSDNPRDENPDDILSDMLAGLTAEQKDKTLTISDRRQAIRTACKLAKSGDVILIAGKGHEDYQIIKGVKHHFDDREEIKAALQ
ncbi:MAG: hypothetical protein LBN95_03540, partial [Prevotellaceae bacterium]|nr:hypothetical protein [Prevotellaceae bacterium]